VLVPPSPKLHDHDVGLPLDRSVKFTVSGAVPDVGEPEKFATGALDVPGTVKFTVLLSHPSGFCTHIGPVVAPVGTLVYMDVPELLSLLA